MPRFYFDIFFGSDAHLDADGHEIGSPRAAEIIAKRAAGQIALERLLHLPNEVPESIQVEVKDEHRRPIVMVTVSIQIDQALNAASAVANFP